MPLNFKPQCSLFINYFAVFLLLMLLKAFIALAGWGAVLFLLLRRHCTKKMPNWIIWSFKLSRFVAIIFKLVQEDVRLALVSGTCSQSPPGGAGPNMYSRKEILGLLPDKIDLLLLSLRPVSTSQQLLSFHGDRAGAAPHLLLDSQQGSGKWKALG